MTSEFELQKPYMVLVKESNGYGEDPRGNFETYDEAYEAFEAAVRFVDELTSKVEDYSATLDTVQLIKNETLVLLWQRPPWRTGELLREWALRQGHTTAEFVRFMFLDVTASAQQAHARDVRNARA